MSEQTSATTTVALPALAGGRLRAYELAASVAPNEPHGAIVVRLDGSSLLAASPSFADELVLQLLIARPGTTLVLTRVDSRTERLFLEAAHRHTVGDRLSVD